MVPVEGDDGRALAAALGGLVSGRKAFQRPLAEGDELLHAIQDVYLCKEVTIA